MSASFGRREGEEPAEEGLTGRMPQPQLTAEEEEALEAQKWAALAMEEAEQCMEAEQCFEASFPTASSSASPLSNHPVVLPRRRTMMRVGGGGGGLTNLHAAPPVTSIPSFITPQETDVIVPATTRLDEMDHSFPLGNALPATAHEAAEQPRRGVLDLPPLDCPSVVLRGDNGTVCWVTMQRYAKNNEEELGNDTEPRPGRKRRRSPTTQSTFSTAVDPFLASSQPAYGTIVESCSSDEDSEASLGDGGGYDGWRGQLWSDGGGCRSIADMMDKAKELELEQQRRKDVLDEEDRRLQAFLAQSKRESEEEEGQGLSQTLRAELSMLQEDGLLVTRFRPRAFRELLSEETLNLKLLQWLQSWSPYVFGSPTARKATGMEEEAEDLKDPGAAKEKSSRSADSTGSVALLPEDRLVVLAGPPGCGKTVLVQVLAAHAGYELLEVNASSERSISRLQSVIQMVSSAGTSRQPRPTEMAQRLQAKTNASANVLVEHLLRAKCLLLDEMDGLTSDVVDYLLAQDLRRPVFCVCNDLYAPSLRRLRVRYGHCTYRVQPIRPQRLLSRLEEVVFKAQRDSERQGKPSAFTDLDQSTLAELVVESGGDIRSCLNTLQFLQVQASTSGAVASPGLIIRQQMERDKHVHYIAACGSYLQKMPRHQAILLLRQEYGVDYEALVAQGACELRALQAKKKHESRPQVLLPEERGVDSSPPTIAPGFRVDPGFLYHLRRASSAQLSHLRQLLLDGLFEHYLSLDTLLDYSLVYTSAVAEAISFQDGLTSMSYSTSRGGGDGLVRFAELYELEVTCQTLYAAVARCGNANSKISGGGSSSGSQQAAFFASGGRIHFPQDRYQLDRVQSQCDGVSGALRERCRCAEFLPFWQSVEVLCADWCPYLLRCLFDDTLLQHKSNAGRKWNAVTVQALGPAVQAKMAAAVERHVLYGLTYRPPFAAGGGAAEGPAEASSIGAAFSPSTSSPWATVKVPTWMLDPGVEEVGCLQAHFTEELRGGLRHAAKVPMMLRGTTTMTAGGAGSSSQRTGSYSSGVQQRHPKGGVSSSTAFPSPLRFALDDLRQYMVGEIHRHVILRGRVKSSAANASSATPSNDAPTSGRDKVTEEASPKAKITSNEKENGKEGQQQSDELSSSKVSTGLTVGPGGVIKDEKGVVYKKDFFGRLVPVKSKFGPGGPQKKKTSIVGPSHFTSGSVEGQEEAEGVEGKKPRRFGPGEAGALIKYVVFEGATNAVKMPAEYDDF